MNWKLFILAAMFFSLMSCGSKKEKDEKKQDENKIVLTPQQAAEKYCQCQNELLELSKKTNPDMKAKMKECKDLQTAFDKQYMSDSVSAQTFLDAYFACMPKGDYMSGADSTARNNK